MADATRGAEDQIASRGGCPCQCQSCNIVDGDIGASEGHISTQIVGARQIDGAGGCQVGCANRRKCASGLADAARIDSQGCRCQGASRSREAVDSIDNQGAKGIPGIVVTEFQRVGTQCQVAARIGGAHQAKAGNAAKGHTSLKECLQWAGSTGRDNSDIRIVVANGQGPGVQERNRSANSVVRPDNSDAVRSCRG